MNNSIVATIPFDYKGEHYLPSVVIDLDDFITRELDISNIYQAVASHNQIGPYSYELEVLSSSEINFSDPKGIAEHYFDGSHFDFDGFRENYHEQMALQTLGHIAQKYLHVDDLEQNPSLREALLEAYRYGKGAF